MDKVTQSSAATAEETAAAAEELNAQAATLRDLVRDLNLLVGIKINVTSTALTEGNPASRELALR